MAYEKFEDLISDEDFVRKLINQPTEDDAKKLIEAEGFHMTDEQMEALRFILLKMLEKGELSEEDLKEVTGAGLEAKVIGGLFGAAAGAFILSPLAAKGGYKLGEIGGSLVSKTKHDETGFTKGVGAGIGGTAGAVGGVALGAIGGIKLANWITKK